jgi:MinD-like ATPase involved in chromosome partitioning or flagellar assembly
MPPKGTAGEDAKGAAAPGKATGGAAGATAEAGKPATGAAAAAAKGAAAAAKEGAGGAGAAKGAEARRPAEARGGRTAEAPRGPQRPPGGAPAGTRPQGPPSKQAPTRRPDGASDAAGDRVGQRPAGAGAAWQDLVSRLTGGLVRTRSGELQREQLKARIAAPILGSRKIAMVALKGGVGKTTTTACLGAVLAEHRQDRIVAVDANPDAGTLGYRIRLETTRTAKDLLANVDKLQGYADMRAHASQTNFHRLEVIASDVDPAADDAFGEQDYREVASVLERFYGIVLTDCGPGLLHSAMRSILPSADQLVVISAASLDGSRAASLTLDWLEQHDYGDLARESVVVINAVRPRTLVDIDQLQQHFVRRCRAVVQVPFDRHLETGAEIVFPELSPATRQAYLELAAAVVDGVARPRL